MAKPIIAIRKIAVEMIIVIVLLLGLMYSYQQYFHKKIMQNFIFTRLKLVTLYMGCLEKSRKEQGNR